MNATPVRRYRQPVYPTRLEVLSDPALLKRNVPSTWRAVPELTGALALLLAVDSTGCSKSRSAVAPIFEHGEGRGVMGCVVSAPPVFLSEEEAWQVISEELERHGVTLTRTNDLLQGMRIPRVEYHGREGKPIRLKPAESAREARTWQPDAADATRKIAVEFISHDDFRRLCPSTAVHGWFSVTISTAHEERIRDVARFVAEEVKEKGRDKVFFGTFYDPVSKQNAEDREKIQTAMRTVTTDEEELEALEKGVARPKAESRRLLRLQVQDFVKWLQGQGVI